MSTDTKWQIGNKVENNSRSYGQLFDHDLDMSEFIGNLYGDINAAESRVNQFEQDLLIAEQTWSKD